MPSFGGTVDTYPSRPTAVMHMTTSTAGPNWSPPSHCDCQCSNHPPVYINDCTLTHCPDRHRSGVPPVERNREKKGPQSDNAN